MHSVTKTCLSEIHAKVHAKVRAQRENWREKSAYLSIIHAKIRAQRDKQREFTNENNVKFSGEKQR